MNKDIKKTVSLIFRGWIGSIIIAILIATSIKSAIADWYVVPTGSMKPTIVEGDRIFTNKLAYDLKVPYTTWHIATWGDPNRGEIVVFDSPTDDNRLVKRVIGLPGDLITMSNYRLYINGKAVDYEFLDPSAFTELETTPYQDYQIYREFLPGKKHTMMITPLRPSIPSFGPVIVPQGMYFMMGDNRDNSADSRYFGFVKRKLILGRANTIVISLDRNNHYRPRWERFFQKLQ